MQLVYICQPEAPRKLEREIHIFTVNSFKQITNGIKDRNQGTFIFRQQQWQIYEVLISYQTRPSITESYTHTQTDTHMLCLFLELFAALLLKKKIQLEGQRNSNEFLCFLCFWPTAESWSEWMCYQGTEQKEGTAPQRRHIFLTVCRGQDFKDKSSEFSFNTVN